MSQQENENKKKDFSEENLHNSENQQRDDQENNIEKKETSFSETEKENKPESENIPKVDSEEKSSGLESAIVDEAGSGKSAKDRTTADEVDKSLEEEKIEKENHQTAEEYPKSTSGDAPVEKNREDDLENAIVDEATSDKSAEDRKTADALEYEDDDEEETDEPKTPKSAQEDVDDAVAEDSEDETSHERHSIPKKDYHSMSKEELTDELERLLKNEKVQAIKEHVTEIRTEFNAKFDEEMEEKKEQFLADGGNIIDFHYSTPLKKRFNSLYFDYREKRNNYYKKLKQDLNKNLQNRLEIIEELKGLIDVEENINTTYKYFKELQDRWRVAGPIPREKYNDVWNTYHHHVENFYDFLHLNREFRDMDFKHNLEQKLKVIDRAEELLQEKDINRAFRELQMLHKMWKEELGPVAKDFREDIWERFSAATKKIHEKRQEYFKLLDQEFEKNWERKQEIIDKISAISAEEYKSHHQWQQKIKEIEALRELFFKAGKVPRNKNEETWSRFKEEVRKFNRNKNAYYKNLKKQQYENLEKKKELIKIAEDNKDSEDFNTVTPLMKKIQADWKKIGHVPRKDSDKVWKQFKAACNHYFDRLHSTRKEENKEEFEAYDKKKQVLEELKSLELTGDKNDELQKIKAFIEQWKNIGKVPHNKRFIEGKFNKALDQAFKKLDVDKTEAEMLKYENKLQAIDEADDDRKLQNEHYFLTKKIEETKNEIRQLENNLQFFSNVDDDNPLVQDVYKNIDEQKAQLAVWEEKLRKIKSLY